MEEHEIAVGDLVWYHGTHEADEGIYLVNDVYLERYGLSKLRNKDAVHLFVRPASVTFIRSGFRPGYYRSHGDAQNGTVYWYDRERDIPFGMDRVEVTPHVG